MPQPQALESYRRLDAIDAVTILCEKWGAKQVHSWLTTVAALRGESLPCQAGGRVVRMPEPPVDCRD